MSIRCHQTYNRLTTIRYEMRPRRNRQSQETYFWCRCICGNEKWIRSDAISTGRVKSCGCYRKETSTQRLNNHRARQAMRLIPPHIVQAPAAIHPTPPA